MDRSRDDFASSTVDELGRRVGLRCSNPRCRKSTSGPRSEPDKSINIGVAAHITAASSNGPRYNRSFTAAERKSIDNGIWLCQNCAKLVDNDESRYTVAQLRDWKRESEQVALDALEGRNPELTEQDDDVAHIRWLLQVLDRPAFQDPFHQEGSSEAFDKAIEDTITAINTGCLRSRDGGVLSQYQGKMVLRNETWREQLQSIVDLLRAIRSRYEVARRLGEIQQSENGDHTFHLVQDRDLAQWMDNTRQEIIRIFTEICREASVPMPHGLRTRPGW